MRPITLCSKSLLMLLQKKKVATLPELKRVLGTNVTMTVFRKLKQLDYISSCSHSGKYYSLRRLAQFDTHGLWWHKAILFSSQGSLIKTISVLVEKSDMGFTAAEIENLLKLKPNETLVYLIKGNFVYREKISGIYVYFSTNINRKQVLLRKDTVDPLQLAELKPAVLMNELKAALIIFFSTLNEKQRRLYAGLESMKTGRGGDRMISDLLGINVKTVTKGRKELLHDTISIETIRNKGGGRKKMEKKSRHTNSNRQGDGV